MKLQGLRKLQVVTVRLLLICSILHIQITLVYLGISKLHDFPDFSTFAGLPVISVFFECTAGLKDLCLFFLLLLNLGWEISFGNVNISCVDPPKIGLLNDNFRVVSGVNSHICHDLPGLIGKKRFGSKRIFDCKSETEKFLLGT